MHLERPSKKIIIIGSIAVVLLTTIAIFKFWNFGPQKTNLVDVAYDKADANQTMETDNGIVADASTIDSDHDRLPDWQEALLGTDPHNPDTDGDGTPDGEEVKLGRDPLKKGPDDKITNTFASSTASKTSDDNAPKTISESVSRDLFANAVSLSNSGNVTDENTAALANNLVTQLQGAFNYKQYPASSLTLISNENTETLRFYASSFATLQIGTILLMQKHTRDIEGDVSVLGDIYAKEADDLSKIAVPQEIADVHLEIINNFSKAAETFKAIKNEKKDPLLLPIAIQVYQQVETEQASLMNTVAQFIKANGIIFSKDEAGGYWNAFSDTTQ